ncbi:cysteine--tRNA ligase [Anaeromyxobacter sp. Fw109-5]|uniref:Cysteine--tRNA ligase n=1 Tax=Anaeromyxobacter sp. (strain Fw109-5) TaxID=404589 RepID=SYC_ANADF|nr:cysteine--tRNA ligase [Anaeromyxobacter sp. Fw109-5]A7HDA1.1 RecName: Full=Cysteine--tRNA ligase; AltName: Full=Cysteinyl-tRNA synthetase; Short=CysRS [Anaeromyxobacter sp. Fw109-5]ABS26697.1 cysteinyl-tRNA synthetase [Anaeromyxobacter sp. Fw109-5]
MPIVISDTLTGTKRELQPIEPGKIRFYACGPTVYDSAHVGHGRSYVVWDLVVRHLRARGYEVRYVRNFTDVDDKIIRRATERREDPVALAARYAREFDEDMDALGNLRPDVAPKVSEHVPQIVAMISSLVEKGFAYAAANGDVYFSVRAFPDYGRLSKRNLDDLLSGARVEPGEAKRDPLDFALWKAAKPGEPTWDSPWGGGRPGWHIECSAMTLAHLGVPIDLHGGGKDLVFPHHTNEIAQSAAAVGDGRTAESFCRHWMHHGFVEIDSEKMSKSLGNFFTLRDVLAKFDAEGVRLFYLGTHYRNPINYSDAILAEAERRLNYFYETLEKVDALAEGTSPAGEGGGVVEDARRALDDDFNAPQVLAVLAEAFTAANALADKRGKKTPEDRARLAAFARDVREIGTTLGLVQRRPAEALRAIRARAAARRGIDPASVEAKIVERAEARRARDFARSDAIRDALLAQGVALMDGPQGTTWKVE